MNSNKRKKLKNDKKKSRDFWELVEDEQIFLYTTKEKYGGQGKKKTKDKPKYQTDTYEGIVYNTPLPVPEPQVGQQPIDTTGYKVTKLPSQFK